MRHNLVTSALTAAALAAAVPAAAAAPRAGAADEAAALVRAVAPASGQLTDERATASSRDVEVPTDPTLPIVLKDRAGESAVEVSLPDGVSVVPGTPAADGTVVYEAAENDGVDLAVQRTTDGAVRILTIIPSGSAAHEFTYRFDAEVTPILQDDGGALLVARGSNDHITAVVGDVGAPWAADATGRGVDTTYSVVGGSLVQTIHPDADATYPIVADPSVSLGLGIYVYYSRSEVKNIAGSAVADKIKYLAALCGIIPNPVAAGGCALYAYDSYSSVTSTFKSAANVNKRVEMRYTYSGILVGWKPVA